MSNLRTIQIEPRKITISLNERDYETLKDMCDDAIRYKLISGEPGITYLYFHILKKILHAVFDQSLTTLKLSKV